ncbi:MAG TPA: hypothetical protein VNW04_16515 [Puia sp.]|jgi:hypothetical protein|nr:hypothetical protein [Puia sp.]
MSKYTTRVELHKATSENYETLHVEMEKEGFTRTIFYEDDPNVYQLPTAEYNFGGEIDIEQVRENAKTAASRTGKAYSIIVTKADGPRYIYNLPVVRQRVL